MYAKSILLNESVLNCIIKASWPCVHRWCTLDTGGAPLVQSVAPVFSEWVTASSEPWLRLPQGCVSLSGERQRQCELRRASVRETDRVLAYEATGTSLKHTDHGPIRVWLLQGLGAGTTVVRLRALCVYAYSVWMKCLCHALRSDVVTFRNTSETHYDAW